MFVYAELQACGCWGASSGQGGWPKKRVRSLLRELLKEKSLWFGNHSPMGFRTYKSVVMDPRGSEGSGEELGVWGRWLG